MKTPTTFTILIGLPGSGKSYYATKMEKEDSNTEVIDFDYYFHLVDRKTVTPWKYIGETIYHDDWFCYDNIILDGPWFTGDVIKKLLEDILPEINNHVYYGSTYKIKLVHFDENREACLKNDEDRRDVSSTTTIKNMPYLSEITEEFINELKNLKDMKATDIEVEEREIYNPSTWERALKKVFDLTPEEAEKYPTVTSDYWSNGGDWCDCWGGSGNVSPEAPVEFEKFDEFLGEVCPTITFLQYKNIKNKCVSLKTKDDYDYYGGHTSESYWECNLNDLKECLIKKGLMEE